MNSRLAVLPGLAIFILLAGCGESPPPVGWENPLSLRMTGCEFQWQLRYPGQDGLFDTADDITAVRHLHLPAESTVRLQLQSCDVLYTFAAPAIGLNELAVPGTSYVLELRTGAPGELDFRGDQLCGFQHEQLSGRIVIHSRDDFSRWLAEAGPSD